MILTSLDRFRNTGLLLLRVGVGTSFMLIHGLPKILGGVEGWAGTGMSMANLGITFYPEFWGFMAAFAEFFGAMLLILGFFFRPATFMLTFTMFVAMFFHLSRLDPWGKVAYPLELMFVFAGLFLIGPGRYSIDEYFRKRKEVQRLERETLAAKR